jgi:hypothetical protein
LIADAITAKHAIGHEARTVFDLSSRMASSLAQVFARERTEMDLPTLTFTEN